MLAGGETRDALDAAVAGRAEALLLLDPAVKHGAFREPPSENTPPNPTPPPTRAAAAALARLRAWLRAWLSLRKAPPSRPEAATRPPSSAAPA